MKLAEDTRQQIWGGHDRHANIHRHCKKHDIEIERIALPFGDYCLADNLEEQTTTHMATDPETGERVEKTITKKIPVKGTILADTKQGWLEMGSNLMQDHRRFRDECIRAQEAGCQLVILIEEIPPCGMVELWQSPVFTCSTKYHRAGEPMTRANPANYSKIMKTMTERYGVKFTWCDKHQTGRVLIDILTGKYRI